jgi:hypothetical protein
MPSEPPTLKVDITDRVAAVIVEDTERDEPLCMPQEADK